MQRLMPRKSFVDTWRKLEEDAKELAKRLAGKEAATPSLAWKLLSKARPETILFLDTTTRQQGIAQKIRNFFTKWRQVKSKLPLPEMAELHITPELPVYPKLAEDSFYLLLDGKLRSRTEILKFLKPFAPPPPAPPPPSKRGRAAKAAEAAATPSAPERGKKRKSVEPLPPPAAQPKPQEQKPAVQKQHAPPASAAKKNVKPAARKAETRSKPVKSKKLAARRKK
jgi:hypothetical protein